MPRKRPLAFLGTPLEIRLNVLKFLTLLVMGFIVTRLFYLQVIQHDFYQAKAAKGHYGYTELPARRGEIFIKDYASDETVRVATNVTLDTLYADPKHIENPKLVADRLVPLIFNLEQERETDNLRVETEKKRAKDQQAYDAVKPFTDEELYKNFYDKTLESISQKIRSTILLSSSLDQNVLGQMNQLGLSGIEVKEESLYAYPAQIENRENTASVVAKYLNMEPERLSTILRGENRYTVLARKIKPEVSAEIRTIASEDKDKNFFGIGLQEEYYRYYPEKELAANVLGFVAPSGIGQYGIESKFNTQLQGKTGIFKTQRDGSIYGRQITVGDSVIEPAQDGNDVVLTLDRSMQMTVEKLLAKAVQDYRADSGQVIIMDPRTGRVMTLAHYPNFDPNNYGSALATEEISLSAAEVESLVPVEGEEGAFWFYRNVLAHDRYKVLSEVLEDGTTIYKRYKNWIGLEAFQNKAVAQPYEPGSVFKAVTMASAIDDKDVTPQTAFNDSGTLKVDEFQIRNVSAKCTGYSTMTNVLANSCNTGVGWVAQKMGRNLFYSYMVRFGFRQRTGIEFDNEHPGQISHFAQWAESELVTAAFGQGITATPIQMVAAYGALANKGVLMQPYIVDRVIQKDGKETVTEPVAIQQAVTEATAKTLTAMLVSAVENGVAGNAGVPSHYIAAKTGTSQTYRFGKPLTGAGTTIASIAGFGPIENPQFVLYVKLDRPRSSEWADSTAALLFRDIAAYLYEYLGIPPDKN